MSYPQSLMGRQQDVVGRFVDIVGYGQPQAPVALGYQQSGVPTNLHHGVYGGHPHHRHHGGYPVAAGYQLPPRNELIERAAPTLAGRRLLPMSSGGTNIAYQTSAQITSRPQGIAYRPERITIDSSVGIDSTTPTPVPTVYDASSWVLNDVKVGNISQYMQSGDIPGGMFAPNAVDSFVDFMTVQTAQDFVMIVTFTGFAGTGEGTPAAPFSCGVTGTAAV